MQTIKERLSELNNKTKSIKKETRVYLIEFDNVVEDCLNLSNEEWIEVSESQGFVLSLEGYQRAYNKEEIPCNTYLRFITIGIESEQYEQNINDLSCRITNELVDCGLVRDCTDTIRQDEWNAQDIIVKHIKKYNNR